LLGRIIEDNMKAELSAKLDRGRPHVRSFSLLRRSALGRGVEALIEM
jgi:hypothetical protein